MDRWNIKEFNGTDEEFKELYKIDKPLLQFKRFSEKRLTQMHIRSSSLKESIDFNHKLVVLFLFEDELYMYIQLDESR